MRLGINPPNVWAPRGRGFSMGLAHNEGITVHFTGQVAWDASERIVGVGDVERQTRQCFDNIKLVLGAVGGQVTDLVSITTYYTERPQLPLIQKVRAKYLDFEDPPVSTSVMVAGLGHEHFLVELAPIAVIPPSRFISPENDTNDRGGCDVNRLVAVRSPDRR